MPRRPIWTTLLQSSSPSSTQRLNGVPCPIFSPKTTSLVSAWASTCTRPTGPCLTKYHRMNSERGTVCDMFPFRSRYSTTNNFFCTSTFFFFTALKFSDSSTKYRSNQIFQRFAVSSFQNVNIFVFPFLWAACFALVVAATR